MKARRILTVILVSAFLLTSGIMPNFQAKPVEAATYSWSGWAGNLPPDRQGFKWGFPDLWWYGKAQVFHYGTEIEYNADAATSFWIKGKALPEADESYFGAVAEWGTPLDAGYIYRFSMRITNSAGFPDLIAVNGNIVWEKSEGYANAANQEIHFTYVPESDDEIANIYLIRELDPENTEHIQTWQPIYPPHQHTYQNNNFTSRRADYTDPRPNYDSFDLHEETVFEGIDPHFASSYLYDSFGHGVDYDGYTLPALPYPTADVKVMERWMRVHEGGAYYKYPQTDVVTYQPTDGSNEMNFEAWSDAVIAAGSREIALTPVIDRIHTNGNVTNPGTYKWFHLSSLLNGAPNLNNGVEMTYQERLDKLAQAAEDVATLAHRWLEKVPDGKVYLFEVESSANYGLYKQGISTSNIGLLPGYEEVEDGGSRAWELVFEFIEERFFQAIINDSQLTTADRTKLQTMANFDRAAFQGAYAYKTGADLVVHKNIHRQSINVVTSNSRGAAQSYDKQYGYDFDNWVRQYAFSYHPDEIMHGLKNYFHAGADYIMDEINTLDGNRINEWGKTWLEFWHYAKTHPQRGDQQVRIAVMHGLGDEWNRVGGTSAAWETEPWFPTDEINNAFAMDTVPQKWAKAKLAQDQSGAYSQRDTYFWDNHLLNLLFADFGNAFRTDIDRLATGTPFGPVNFVPWDTSADKLNQYDVLMYFGRGVGITQDELDQLTSYVQSGGTLVMAAGQLRQENHQRIANEFMGIQLGNEDTLEGLPYTELTAPATGQVEKTLSNGDPAVVSAPYGAGKLYLFSGEWLTYWNDEDAENLLQPILENAKWLELAPQSEWLEYMAQHKQNTWVFPFFNNGRGYFPSRNGIDHGAWTGTVSMDLNKLGLAGQEVEVYRANYDRHYDPDTALPFELEAVTSSVVNDTLSFDLTVGTMEEIVIGPKDRVKQEYWGITDYTPITGIHLDPAPQNIYPNDTFQLTANVASDEPGDPVLDWSSSNEQVAKVDEQGVVTAIDEGTATIKVRVADVMTGTVYTDEVVVNVSSRVVYSIEDDFEEDTIGSEPAGWVITPGVEGVNSVTVVEDASNQIVRMDKADSSWAALEAKKELGDDDGGLTGKVVMEVMLNAPNNINKPRILYLDNAAGEELIKLSMAWNWKFIVSDGESDFTTDQSYQYDTWYKVKLVMDTHQGSYDLYVDGKQISSADGGSFEMQNVQQGHDVNTVRFRLQNNAADALLLDNFKAGVEAGAVNGVSVKPENATIQQGESLPLSVVITPEESSERELNFQWTSSDENVAIVDDDGIVTGVGEGSAVIQVVVEDELYDTVFTAQSAVHVEPQQEIQVQDDFDTDATGSMPDGWAILESSGDSTAAVVEEEPGSGEKWLRAEKKNSSAAALDVSRSTGNLEGRVILKTKVKAPTANRTRLILIRNSVGENIIDTRLGYDGQIRVVDGTANPVEVGVNYAASTWIELKYDLDTQTGQYQFFVNGARIGTFQAVPDRSLEVSELAFRFQNGYADVLDIDDVVASTVVLSEAEALAKHICQMITQTGKNGRFGPSGELTCEEFVNKLIEKWERERSVGGDRMNLPDRPITREEAMAIKARVLQLIGERFNP